MSEAGEALYQAVQRRNLPPAAAVAPPSPPFLNVIQAAAASEGLYQPWMLVRSAMAVLSFLSQRTGAEAGAGAPAAGRAEGDTIERWTRMLSELGELWRAAAGIDASHAGAGVNHRQGLTELLHLVGAGLRVWHAVRSSPTIAEQVGVCRSELKAAPSHTLLTSEC